MTEAQAASTRFAARVIGPIMGIIGAVVLLRFDNLVLMMPAILQNAQLSFITGIFTLIVGLILLAAHHHWNSAASIAVSVISVLTIVRGVVLMLAPEIAAGVATQMLHAGAGALIAGAIAIAIGLWLTFVGWFAKQPPGTKA